VLAGGGTGVAGAAGLLLAIVGVTSAFWPIILLLISALCIWRFMHVTGQR